MNVAFDLEAVWKRLLSVKSLAFEATSRTNTVGWSGEGRGSVVVENVDSDTLLFHENGMWKPETGRQLTFSNVYRWTAITESRSLRLEHLRFGHRQPVYLFDLERADERNWQSVEPHVCRDDLYTATMKDEGEILIVTWAINGPTKNESIHYSYY